MELGDERPVPGTVIERAVTAVIDGDDATLRDELNRHPGPTPTPRSSTLGEG